jgi:benzoyl-CoA reductase/2-hydroxyglutaryl-CoA dehydratase subunit BcrC/BadD/HgdB
MSKQEKTLPESTKVLNSIITRYYQEVKECRKEQKPIAWITTMTPIEVVSALDIFVIYPENYSAVCASRKVAAELIDAAERRGYSRDICSYASCNLGMIFEKKGAFGDEGLPRPDMLIATELACDTHVKWFECVSRELGVPLFIMDAAYRVNDTPQDYQRAYYQKQLKNLIRFLEEQTKRKLDFDHFKEIIDYSDKASELWNKISTSRKNVPSPVTTHSIFSGMFPMVTLAGKPEAVDFYRLWWSEVKEAVDNKQGGIPNEKYRLLWDIFPLWHDLKVFTRFEQAGAVFVADLYADSFSQRLDPSDPFNSLTDKYLCHLEHIEGASKRMARYRQMVEEYKINGAVFHSNRVCRYESMGQLLVQKFLKDELHLPVLMFESDHVDPTKHSKSLLDQKIDMFLEMLASRYS